MNTFTDPDTGIRFDYQIIQCSEDYADCEIYAVMPTDEEYLLRVYSEVKDSTQFVGPFDSLRYSKNRVDAFDDCEHNPPNTLIAAFSKIAPHVHQLVSDERAAKLVTRHKSLVTPL